MKYLDLEGLTLYDSQIKQYIEDNIPEAATALVNAMGNESGEENILKVAVCTQEEYDALEIIDPNCLYFISNDDTYDTIENDIDTIKDNIDTIEDDIDTIESDILSLSSGKVSTISLNGVNIAKDLNQNIALTNIEQTTNKVTFTDGWSETPTDTNYPSEKLVKDSLDDIDDSLSSISNALIGINLLIPNQASHYNQLADKDFVNSSINSNAAFFRGNYDNLETATESGNTCLLDIEWQCTDPEAPYYASNNDYAYVNDDETQNHEAWRYIYVVYAFIGQDIGIWEPQFKVNDAPLTAAQLAALNSGVTSSLVEQIPHTNRQVIDGITAADIESWNDKVTDEELATKLDKYANGGTNWITKVWEKTNLPSDIGFGIWSDGNHTYYSYSATQLIFNDVTEQWEDLPSNWWGDFDTTYFFGRNVWFDLNNNIYYSSDNNNYKLNKDTNLWENVTMVTPGYTINGGNVWNDGYHVYFSVYDSSSTSFISYILDESTMGSTSLVWNENTVTGWNNIVSARYIWSDGENLYYNYTGNITAGIGSRMFDKGTHKWEWPINWTIDNQSNFGFDGTGIWHDGNHTYLSISLNQQYELDTTNWTGKRIYWTPSDLPISNPSNYLYTINNTTYYCYASFTNQYYQLSKLDVQDIIDANSEARHTHTNKAVLDGISSTDVTHWNNKVPKEDIGYFEIAISGLTPATSTYSWTLTTAQTREIIKKYCIIKLEVESGVTSILYKSDNISDTNNNLFKFYSLPDFETSNGDKEINSGQFVIMVNTLTNTGILSYNELSLYTQTGTDYYLGQKVSIGNTQTTAGGNTVGKWVQFTFQVVDTTTGQTENMTLDVLSKAPDPTSN